MEMNKCCRANAERIADRFVRKQERVRTQHVSEIQALHSENKELEFWHHVADRLLKEQRQETALAKKELRFYKQLHRRLYQQQVGSLSRMLNWGVYFDAKRPRGTASAGSEAGGTNGMAGSQDEVLGPDRTRADEVNTKASRQGVTPTNLLSGPPVGHGAGVVN